PLMELEVSLGAKTTLVSGYGQNDEQVQSGSQVSWRPWIDGQSLPLHVRNAGPDLLPFPTAQLSGAAAALFEIVGPTSVALLAADAKAVFELRPRSTLPLADQTLTVTFSTGGAVLDYSFQVIWKSNASQSFAAPQVSLVKAVIHPKGQRLILTPSVNGSQVMTYRWSREGRTVPGQTRASLDLASLEPEDAGYYQVEVKSGTHTVFSNICELVVFEPQSGVIPMRDDQSARFTTKVWGRAYIKWLGSWESPYLFGLNSPTLTIVNGRYLRDNLLQEELSAVAVVGNYQGVPLAETEVARYTLRSVGRVPRLFNVFAQDHLVGDTIQNEVAMIPLNAMDMNGLNTGFPGSILRATDLPAGLTIDSATGNLSGTFTKAGVFRVTWSLTDFLGRKSTPLVTVIRVGQPLRPAEPGVYAGIVSGSAELPDFKMGGYLELNMEEAGSFSGVLRINAVTRRFASRLKPLSSSYYECELPMAPLAGTKKLRLILMSEPSATPLRVQVIATLADDRTETWECGLSFRAQGAALVSPDLVGRYNTLLTSDLLDEGVYPPQGSSFMSLHMSPGSNAVAVGSLVDGTGFTCACPVMKGGDILILPFYVHSAAQGSTLAGALSLDVFGSLTFATELQWRQIAKPGARLYPEGFRLSLRGTGGRYIMPPAGHTLLAHGPDAPGNAVFSSDPFNFELESTIFRLTADHRALLPRSTPGLNRVTRIDFHAPTGFFTGEIMLEPTIGEGEKRIPGGKVGFRGMMIPYQSVGGGYYHRRNIFLNEGPFVSRGVSIWRGL
ncbi:MAG: putative Ig domain-containing protein, partial [Prosthecobacter sp.]